jgi:serine protease Do
VEIRDLDATEVKTAPDGGAFVTSIRRETPAEKAGFQVGDIVIEFDGERVRSARQLGRIVEETRPGREVKAVVVRTGARRTLTVTPEMGRVVPSATPNVRVPGAPLTGDLFLNRSRTSPQVPFFTNSTARLGVTVAPLTDQLGAYFGAKQGVLVTAVSDDTPAARAGLKAGDVIVDIGNMPVTTAADVVSALSPGTSDGRVELHVIRDKKDLRLTATVPASPARPF